RESWAVLKQDKEIMLFPIISAIASILVFIVMATVFFFVVLGGSMEQLKEVDPEQGQGVASYVILFAYYLAAFFVASFFQAGMYIIVHARFTGRDLNFSDGINGAMQNINKIFLWSLISATVGIVLQFIANRSKVVGKIVSALLGAAWDILTYFSLPSLVIGQTSIKDSFRDSAGMIRKTWGETIIINLGVGLLFGILMVLGIFVGLTFVIIVQGLFMTVVAIALVIIYLLSLTIISSSLNAIFKLALYEYARTGIVPQGFSPELIQNAVKSGIR
ncbi:MAG: hypothetical protein A2494_03795, partial [Candidatus Lloydbacteria bacterium RIFOXYC12_FULL_46_25]